MILEKTADDKICEDPHQKTWLIFNECHPDTQNFYLVFDIFF